MNKFRRISAAARHRLVFDLRIPLFGSWEFFPADAGPLFEESGIFRSRLTQPVFTRLANLLENIRDASERYRRWREEFHELA
jgi:hypothetical protein